MRLFNWENRFTFENLLTPVRNVNLTCASQSLITPYSPRRQSRLARAVSGSSSASRIGLSYSSTSTATRWPDFRCSACSRRRKRDAAFTWRGGIPASSSRYSSCSVTSSSRRPGSLNLALPKLSRTTGWRTDHFPRSWICRPENSASLPSNSSFSVSRNRLLPTAADGTESSACPGPAAAVCRESCRRGRRSLPAVRGRSGCRSAVCVCPLAHP